MKSWIQDLLSKGMLPTMIEIEKTYYSDAFKREKHWINHYEQTVGDLFNRRHNSRYSKAKRELPIIFLTNK